jgi:hypothetical protein
MNEFTPPVQSLKTLFISSLLATVLAVVILITAILPAEYGIDPTGLGKIMGLTVLAPAKKPVLSVTANSNPSIPSDISIKEIDPKFVEEQMPVFRQEATSLWKDTVMITIPPLQGLEYKFYLEKGANLGFEWKSDGEKIHFDFHGEPKGNSTGYFKSFKITTDNKSSGTLTAPFAGSHGWYWENKTRTPIKIFLKTKGNYRILGLM